MDLTGLTLNTADAMGVAVIVLVASGIIWGIRKALSFVKQLYLRGFSPLIFIFKFLNKGLQVEMFTISVSTLGILSLPFFLFYAVLWGINKALDLL